MAPEAAEKLIGRITHYFSNLSVGIIELTDGELKVGDTIHIKGKHPDFTQTLDSMPIEHQNVTQAKKRKGRGDQGSGESKGERSGLPGLTIF